MAAPFYYFSACVYYWPYPVFAVAPADTDSGSRPLEARSVAAAVFLLAGCHRRFHRSARV